MAKNLMGVEGMLPPPTKIFNGFVTSVVVHLGIYNVGKRFIIQDFKQ